MDVSGIIFWNWQSIYFTETDIGLTRFWGDTRNFRGDAQ